MGEIYDFKTGELVQGAEPVETEVVDISDIPREELIDATAGVIADMTTRYQEGPAALSTPEYADMDRTRGELVAILTDEEISTAHSIAIDILDTRSKART